MTWHVDADLQAAYDGGRLDTARVMAVDAHLIGCADCRAAVPGDAAWLARSWAGVFDGVVAPAPAARGLHRLGMPYHRIRLLTATPALRWSWLAATAAVLVFAVLAAHLAGAGRPTLLVFLVVAPILPVLAVAGAYGARVDAMHEITATTPAAGPGLVLLRSATVVGVSMAMSAAAALVLPGPGWYAVAWLLPAFLLSTGSLALATTMPLPLAAGLLGTGWLATAAGALVLSAGLSGPVQAQLFGPSAQAVYLVAALGAAAVLIVRRGRLEPGGSR